MTPEGARRQAVLSDSEATLRQVQGFLAELGSPSDVDLADTIDPSETNLRDMVGVLMNTYAEIVHVIDALRHSRGLLEQAAVDRLKSTNARLAEVSSATEVAATSMLDGLDRALVLVDHMESAAEEGDPGELRDTLREELHSLMHLLQFQDITAQQLGYASGVLLDMEERMVELARVFDLRGWGAQGRTAQPGSEASECQVTRAAATCDPAASHFDSDSRQAVADEIFR